MVFSMPSLVITLPLKPTAATSAIRDTGKGYATPVLFPNHPPEEVTKAGPETQAQKLTLLQVLSWRWQRKQGPEWYPVSTATTEVLPDTVLQEILHKKL